jgi:hypothetical protein
MEWYSLSFLLCFDFTLCSPTPPNAHPTTYLPCFSFLLLSKDKIHMFEGREALTTPAAPYPLRGIDVNQLLKPND